MIKKSQIVLQRVLEPVYIKYNVPKKKRKNYQNPICSLLIHIDTFIQKIHRYLITYIIVYNIHPKRNIHVYSHKYRTIKVCSIRMILFKEL